MPQTQKKLQWGIAGAGKIGARFARDLVGAAENGALAAVAAREEARARDFARGHGGVKAYGSYEELARDRDVEAVYVATIHPFHAAMARLFLAHGKHVLVEKPAAVNRADWDAMARLARARDLLLLEAMKVPTFPAFQKLAAFFADNPDAKITHVEAAFGDSHPAEPALHIFDPGLCGGASLDVGVYPLWLYALACRLTGAAPGAVTARFARLSPDCAVDNVAHYRFEGAIAADLQASIVERLRRDAVLKGPDLEIRIAAKWWNPKIIDISWRGAQTRIEAHPAAGGFECEAMHFADLVRRGARDSALIPHALTRQVIGWIEDALSAHGFGHLTKAKG